MFSVLRPALPLEVASDGGFQQPDSNLDHNMSLRLKGSKNKTLRHLLQYTYIVRTLWKCLARFHRDSNSDRWIQSPEC